MMGGKEAETGRGRQEGKDEREKEKGRKGRRERRENQGKEGDKRMVLWNTIWKKDCVF